MARRLVDGPGAEVGLDLDPGDELAVGLYLPRHSRRHVLDTLDERLDRRLGHAALTGYLDPARERGAPLAAVLVPGRLGPPVHPKFTQGPIADRCRLAPMIGMGMRAHQQADLLETQSNLVHSPLELRHRVGLVHARVDEHDPVAGRYRPGIAVRNARPRQRQAQPPQPG